MRLRTPYNERIHQFCQFRFFLRRRYISAFTSVCREMPVAWLPTGAVIFPFWAGTNRGLDTWLGCGVAFEAGFFRMVVAERSLRPKDFRLQGSLMLSNVSAKRDKTEATKIDENCIGPRLSRFIVEHLIGSRHHGHLILLKNTISFVWGFSFMCVEWFVLCLRFVLPPLFISFSLSLSLSLTHRAIYYNITTPHKTPAGDSIMSDRSTHELDRLLDGQ